MLATLPLSLETAMHQLFILVQQDSRILLFVKDRQSNVLFANEAFLELHPPEERATLIGNTSYDSFDEVEAAIFNAEDIKAFETGYAEIVEDIKDYTGRTRTLHTRKIRFEDVNNVPMILGMALDISPLVEHEKALAQSNLALENFAAVAAHDLRSPLSALRTSLDAIRDDANTYLSPRSKVFIDLMETSLDGLMDQVSNLLRACKIGGDEALVFEDCDLPVLFEEVRFNLSSKIGATQARVLTANLPRIRANKPMFRQLLHNLIENSLKYRSDETPIIILRYHEEKGFHQFALEDNGKGVTVDNPDAVFSMGMQADGNTPGYGIGLSLCRKIVESHGGRIWVDTGYTSGCRMCFEIPV